MALYKNGEKISKIYINGEEISKMYKGGELIYQNITLPTIYDTIMNKSQIIDTPPDFSQIDTSQSINKLYKEAEDTDTTYYFRGNVQDNWVKFGKDSEGNDYYWRIIRINGNKSIRLIYNGTEAVQTGVTTILNGNSYFNRLTENSKVVEDNALIGFMYGDLNQSQTKAGYNNTHKNINSSDVKKQLDDWYENTFLKFTNNGKNVKTYIDREAGFICDRTPYAKEESLLESDESSISGAGQTTTYYAPFLRILNNKRPSFWCRYPSNDYFTVSDGDVRGNGALTYPVGLITADEAMFAGGIREEWNSDFYLNNDRSCWTMSPYKFYRGYAEEFIVHNTGSITDHSIAGTNNVRPVINIKGTSKILKGEGTIDAPYEIM